MTLELGLQLAQSHLVTRWQLENALQAQLIYRGPLLTNLIKLGYLPEEDGIRFCSQIHNIPIIKENLLRRIPERTLRMIPKDFVFRWRLLPVGVREGTLLLASHIPIPPERLTELAFLVGMRTRAALCPERLLIQAVRYYYTLTLPSWTVDERVIGQFEEPEPLDGKDATTPPGLESSAAETVPPTEAPRRASLHDTLIPQDEERFLPDESVETDDAMQEHVDQAMDLVRSSLAHAEESPGEPSAILADPLESDTTDKAPPLPEMPPLETDTAASVVFDFDAFEDSLALAEDRDEIIQAACSWLVRKEGAALFVNAKQGVLSGFYAEGVAEDVDIRAIALPADSPAAFAQASETGECVTAEIADDEGLSALAEALNLARTGMALLMPVHLRGRMVGMLVVLSDQDKPPVANDPELLRRIRRLVSDTFETLILSKKIGV